MKKKKSTWIKKSEEMVLQTPIMSIVKENRVHSEDPEKKHTFLALKSPDWCNIIPVTAEGKVVLIEQFRTGVDETLLEIPGGVVDTTDSDLETAAIRELEEETGYTPLPQAKVQYLGWNYPNPAFQNNRCHHFIVGPVAKTKNTALDLGEILETQEVSIQDIGRLLSQRKINHALILNAFLSLLFSSEDFSSLTEKELKKYSDA